MPRSRLWLLPLLLAVMVGGGWYFTFRNESGDRELPVYMTGASRMVAGEEIYRRGSDSKPFTYPPFAAVPFVPLLLLPDAWQPAAWFVVNFILLVAICSWLHRFGAAPLPGAPEPRLGHYWLLTALFGGHHVLSVFANQSQDLLILGAVALATAAWCRGRLAAGAWAGCGAAIKATPLLFAVLFLVRRRLGAAALMFGVALALGIAPDLLFPRSDGRLWLSAWYSVNLQQLEIGGTAAGAGAWNTHSFLNQSLSGTLTRLLTPPLQSAAFVDQHAALCDLPRWAFRWVSLLAQVGVLVLVAAVVLRAAARVRLAPDQASMQARVGLAEAGAIACGMVLLSPMSSKSHFCIWLLPGAFLADRLLRGGRDRLLWGLAGGAMALGALSTKGLIGVRAGNRLLAWGVVTWATLLLLFALLRSLRAQPAAAGPVSGAPVLAQTVPSGAAP